MTPEPAAGESLRDAIKTAVLAFGGKAAHYSIVRRTQDVPIQSAFAVPVYYYDQFMTQNGLWTKLDGVWRFVDSQFTTGVPSPAPDGPTSPTNPGFPRVWRRFSDGVDEVIDARMYSGFHYRNSDEVGARVGRQVAKYVVGHALK